MIRNILISTLALVMLSACVQDQNDELADFDSQEGNLVTSAMYNIDGNVFEAQISVDSAAGIDAYELDEISSLLKVVPVAKVNAQNPSWLSVELYALTAGVHTEDYHWQVTGDLNKFFNQAPNTDLKLSDTNTAGQSWESPSLGDNTPHSPAAVTYQPNTKRVDTGDDDLTSNDFEIFDFDPEDYLIESYRTPKKRHRKRH